MTVEIAITYGADFSETKQVHDIGEYVDRYEYTEEDHAALVAALLAELRAEVDKRLPDDFTWLPATSQFVYNGRDTGNSRKHIVNLPEHDEMAALFTEAWETVVARLDDIEAEALSGS
jgi:hypothetical protein